MKSAILALLAVCVCVGQEPMSRVQLFHSFVVTPQNAFFVAPPRLVSDANFGSMEFSPDGRFAVLVGTARVPVPAASYVQSAFGPGPDKAPPKPIYKVWDIKADVIKDLSPAIVELFTPSFTPETSSELGAPTSSVAGSAAVAAPSGASWSEVGWSTFEWTASPGVLFFTKLRPVPNSEDQVEETLYRINIAEGTVNPVRRSTGTSYHRFYASPNKNLAVYFSSTSNRPIDPVDLKSDVSFEIMDLKGNVLKKGSGSFKGVVYFMDWTVDGTNLVGSASARQVAGGPRTITRLVLNTATASINATQEKLPMYSQVQTQPEIDLAEGDGVAKFGEVKADTRSLWLRSTMPSKEPPVLVAADADPIYWLSPDNETIAYLSKGRLFSCSVAKVSIDAFNKAKAAAARDIAVSNAKQVALAVLIYSSDCDDFAPLASNFQDGIYPYLKSREVMEGFVYTFKGGSFEKVDEPARTELGYIPVPGGRAVAYVDGHVKFIADP